MVFEVSCFFPTLFFIRPYKGGARHRDIRAKCRDAQWRVRIKPNMKQYITTIGAAIVSRPDVWSYVFVGRLLLEELASTLHYDALVVLAYTLALQVVEGSGGRVLCQRCFDDIGAVTLYG